MRTVYKYAFKDGTAPDGGEYASGAFLNDLEMPSGATVLRVGHDAQELLCIWAMVDPSALVVRRRFAGYLTGATLDEGDDRGAFLETVLTGDLVWHIFDRGEVTQPSPSPADGAAP